MVEQRVVEPGEVRVDEGFFVARYPPRDPGEEVGLDLFHRCPPHRDHHTAGELRPIPVRSVQLLCSRRDSRWVVFEKEPEEFRGGQRVVACGVPVSRRKPCRGTTVDQ